MEVGVGLRGTTHDQDVRWTNKDAKLLRTMKFPPEFDQKVDMRKVELEVMKPWITKQVTMLLGFEDEVVIEYVNGLLEDANHPVIDPKKMTISLTGFLEGKTSEFMAELWRLLLSAQASPLKVPPEFIEQKKLEMRERAAKEEKAVARRQEEAVKDQQIDQIRQRERRDRRDQRDNGQDFRNRPRDSGWGARGPPNGQAEPEHEERGPPRDRPRRRFESPPRDRPPPRRSPSPEPRYSRDAPRGRSPSRSPVQRQPSPRAGSRDSRSPPPRRRRRSSTPPRRRRYSPSPEPRRRRRDSRSPSPRPRQRRRSYSRSVSRSPPPRRRDSRSPPPRRRLSRSPPRRRSPFTPPRPRRDGSTPSARGRSLTPDEPRRTRREEEETLPTEETVRQ